ncbi:hypothetical protein SADUNF_Sadunf10G0037200 [Salix dunnii]|uniref:Uncharacterized protein n=1 Tax=Salix dunnii TaxID=1413687 RepID=A0A835MR88_9ROSI|nr:hypothetical protein SADUNF_Sadunf10G0037200 [Salix dunnii]
MRSLKMQITYLLVLLLGVVVLAAPSFADYYIGPKNVPKPLYSKPPQVENQLPVFKPPKWFPKKPPKLPKFKFSPPPPSRKRLPPYLLFVGVVVLAAPSFADYYKGPKHVPKPLYSKPPQTPKRELPPLFVPPPPPRKPLPTPYRHYLGHPPVENAQNIKPNN